MRAGWKYCNIFILYEFTGKKKKKAQVHMKGRQSLSPVFLHVVFCGLVTLNYHIQFYGLFYERLLF